MSWIDQEDDDEGILDKEPMETIQCYFIYVGTDQSIHRVWKESQVLETCPHHPPDDRVISREHLLQIIYSKKNHPSTTNSTPHHHNTQYRLLEILLYNVDLENHDLHNLHSGLLTSVTMMDEIVIPPSLCVFHDINCLYFIFQEIWLDHLPPKPILKISADVLSTDPHDLSLPPKRKKTKKVAFKDDFRHTKKNLPSDQAPTQHPPSPKNI